MFQLASQVNRGTYSKVTLPSISCGRAAERSQQWQPVHPPYKADLKLQPATCKNHKVPCTLGSDYFSCTIFQLGLTRKEGFPHREWDEALPFLYEDNSSVHPLPNCPEKYRHSNTLCIIYFCKVSKAEWAALCSSATSHSLMSSAAQIVSWN